MKILCIDTSSKLCSVAILKDKKWNDNSYVEKYKTGIYSASKRARKYYKIRLNKQNNISKHN